MKVSALPLVPFDAFNCETPRIQLRWVWRTPSLLGPNLVVWASGWSASRGGSGVLLGSLLGPNRLGCVAETRELSFGLLDEDTSTPLDYLGRPLALLASTMVNLRMSHNGKECFIPTYGINWKFSLRSRQTQQRVSHQLSSPYSRFVGRGVVFHAKKGRSGVYPRWALQRSNQLHIRGEKRWKSSGSCVVCGVDYTMFLQIIYVIHMSQSMWSQ